MLSHNRMFRVNSNKDGGKPWEISLLSYAADVSLVDSAQAAQTAHAVFIMIFRLIAALEYGMEHWNGKWNGTVSVHSCG